MRQESGLKQMHMEAAFTEMLQRVREGTDALAPPAAAAAAAAAGLGDSCEAHADAGKEPPDLAAELNGLFAAHRIAVMEGIAQRLRASGPALVEAVQSELRIQAQSAASPAARQHLGSQGETATPESSSSPLWRRTRKTLSLAGALSPVRKVREVLAGSD